MARSVEKILIVFLHGIGDCVVATPVVSAFKRAHGAHRISILVRGDTDAADVWSGNSAVDEVLRYDGSYPRYWHPLYHFGRRWSLERDLYRIARSVSADRVVHVTTGAVPTLCRRIARFPCKQDMIARQLRVKLLSRVPELFPSRQHRAAADNFLRLSARKRLVAVNRCGSAFSKFWSIEEYESLCDTLSERGFAVVQCYTAKTRQIEIANDGRAAKTVSGLKTDALGNSHLLVTASILERCEAVVSTDSGVMHLAAAMHRPTVGIFTSPHWMADASPIWTAPSRFLTGQASAKEVLSALDDIMTRGED